MNTTRFCCLLGMALSVRHAGGARVVVSDNEVRNFQDTAIVVKPSRQPAHVFGNRAISDNEDAQAATVDGPCGIVGENQRISTTDE